MVEVKELTPKQLFIKHRGNLYVMKDFAGNLGVTEQAIYNRLASEKAAGRQVPVPLFSHVAKNYYLKKQFIEWWNSLNHNDPVDNTPVSCEVDGVTYPSIREASRNTGIASSTLACRIIKKKKELA